MRRRHILVGLTTCFFAAGVFSVGSVKAETATSAEAKGKAVPGAASQRYSAFPSTRPGK